MSRAGRWLAALAFVLFAACSPEANWPDRIPVVVDPGVGPERGSGAVILLEYGSLTCPACREFYTSYLPVLESDTTLKFRYMYREALLNRSDDLLHLAALVSCGGDAIGYWKAKSAILSEAGASPHPPGTWDEAVAHLASRWQIDPAGLAECAGGEARRQRLRAQATGAESAGVRATPTFVVGRVRSDGTIAGWPLVGVPPLDTLRAYLKWAADSDPE